MEENVNQGEYKVFYGRLPSLDIAYFWQMWYVRVMFVGIDIYLKAGATVSINDSER